VVGTGKYLHRAKQRENQCGKQHNERMLMMSNTDETSHSSVMVPTVASVGSTAPPFHFPSILHAIGVSLTSLVLVVGLDRRSTEHDHLCESVTVAVGRRSRALSGTIPTPIVGKNNPIGGME